MLTKHGGPVNSYWWSFLFGIIFFVVGIYILRKEIALRKNGVRATGVIVDVIRERSEDGTLFRPVVQFTTHEGQKIVWRCSWGGTHWKTSRGEQMRIIYDPQNPQEVIRSNWSSAVSAVAFVSAGVLLCIISLFFH
jgi:hypothetical protein